MYSSPIASIENGCFLSAQYRFSFWLLQISLNPTIFAMMLQVDSKINFLTTVNRITKYSLFSVNEFQLIQSNSFGPSLLIILK
jgi:hypothetical protein